MDSPEWIKSKEGRNPTAFLSLLFTTVHGAAGVSVRWNMASFAWV